METMMAKMDRLKREARAAATFKGHKLGRFSQSVITMGSAPQTQRLAVVASCKICGALVMVDPAPPPEEEEILGAAVEMECLGIDWEGHETA
jgi:hypothetical protein